MAKKESTLWQLVLSLTTITALAAVALTVVYSLTKEPIKAIEIEKNNKAKMDVLPGFDLNKGKFVDTKVKLEAIEDSIAMTLAYQDNVLFGAAVQTFTNMAFSGRFDIMVGFDIDGNILETAVLSHKETPGLGDKIDKSKSDFPLQFIGLNPATDQLVVTKDGGPIDAITASTITSRAFCDAIVTAHKAFTVAKTQIENLEMESNIDSTNNTTESETIDTVQNDTIEEMEVINE